MDIFAYNVQIIVRFAYHLRRVTRNYSGAILRASDDEEYVQYTKLAKLFYRYHSKYMQRTLCTCRLYTHVHTMQVIQFETC